MPPERSSLASPKQIVEDGYDAIAERYLTWVTEPPSPARMAALNRLLADLKPTDDVLELGCGAGVPVTRALADRCHSVLGVDISARQVELARRNVPIASFRKADMTSLDLPSAAFDAVVAFYSLTHVPRHELTWLMRSITRWLRPSGLFFATMGADDAAGDIEQDWLGAPMYFSHFDAERNEQLVAEAGLLVTSAEVVEELEDGSPVRFLWLTARKSSSERG